MSGSVTNWLAAFREGDREAAQLLWNRYYAKLVRVARSRLRGLPAPLSDEEDIALAAFESFCRAIEANRYPDVCDRKNLWHLLLFITACKATRAAQYETRSKRAFKRLVAVAPEDFHEFDELVGREPSPTLALETAESLGRLLSELGDGQLKEMVILRMEGYRNAEIAALLDCSESTVDRKFRRIRQTWSHHIGL